MSTPSTIARMILACLETAYVREVFLHAVSHVQNKANPDKPPHESAVSQIQQAKHLHEMFVKDLQIEHRLTLLAETAAQIVNGEPFQVPGQSAPTPPTPEHGQNQQPTESDLTLNQLTLTQSTKLRRQGLGESVHSSDNATPDYKQMYEILVKNLCEVAFKAKGGQDVLLEVDNTILNGTNHKV